MNAVLLPEDRTMNRHQRRAAKKAAWAAGIAAVAEEAAGMMALDVVRPTDAPTLFALAATGDREATRLAGAVVNTLRHVHDCGTGATAALCGSCDNQLIRMPFSCVIASPQRDDPTNGIGLGICADCATEPEAIGQKAIIALRRVFPDGRAITLQGHAGGRA